MPNIVINHECNRKCPYCFAMSSREQAAPANMGWREVVDIAERLIASGRPRAGVLGGEAALHPDFGAILKYLVMVGVTPRVFTNGIWKPAQVDQLAPFVKSSRIQFVVNVNFPEIESDANRRRQRDFLARFRGQCDLGINIYRTDLSLLFLADLLRDTGIRDRRIRIGVAQPMATGENQFLPLAEYPTMAARVVELAEAVFELGMKLRFDCGMPLCMFTDEQLGRLTRLGALARFYCEPALDVAAGLEAWACYPLRQETRVSLGPEFRFPEAQEQLAAMQDAVRDRVGGGILPECGDCDYRRREICSGGCLSHGLCSESRARRGASLEAADR